jgi:hypothetical protein
LTPREDASIRRDNRLTYAYDRLGRLASATHEFSPDQQVSWTNDWTDSFTHDQVSNMLTNAYWYWNGTTTTTAFNVVATNNRLSSYTKTYSLDPLNPTTYTTSYDTAGNLATEGSKTYTYDGVSRLKAMTGPNNSQGTYRFDALGRRVKNTWSYLVGPNTVSGSMISVYGPGGELLTEYKNQTDVSGTQNTTTHHIQMNGQTIAKRVTGTIYGGSVDHTEWLHRNHLNKVVGADYAGTTNGQGQIATYSRPYNSGGSDQFQGHKDDPESGLHYRQDNISAVWRKLKFTRMDSLFHRLFLTQGVCAGSSWDPRQHRVRLAQSLPFEKFLDKGNPK